MICKQGGISRDSKHLLPHISYRDEHSKKYNTNRRIRLSPTLQVVTESSLINDKNIIKSLVTTSIVFTLFKYRKDFKLTEQLLEYHIN